MLNIDCFNQKTKKNIPFLKKKESDNMKSITYPIFSSIVKDFNFNMAKVFGMIYSMLRNHQYCFYSDDFFLKYAKISRSTLHRILKSLEDNGLIVRTFFKSNCFHKRNIQLAKMNQEKRFKDYILITVNEEDSSKDIKQQYFDTGIKNKFINNTQFYYYPICSNKHLQNQFSCSKGSIISLRKKSHIEFSRKEGLSYIIIGKEIDEKINQFHQDIEEKHYAEQLAEETFNIRDVMQTTRPKMRHNPTKNDTILNNYDINNLKENRNYLKSQILISIKKSILRIQKYSISDFFKFVNMGEQIDRFCELVENKLSSNQKISLDHYIYNLIKYSISHDTEWGIALKLIEEEKEKSKRQQEKITKQKQEEEQQEIEYRNKIKKGIQHLRNKGVYDKLTSYLASQAKRIKKYIKEKNAVKYVDIFNPILEKIDLSKCIEEVCYIMTTNMIDLSMTSQVFYELHKRKGL